MSVYPFVCFDCEQNSLKSYEWILMNFSGKVGNVHSMLCNLVLLPVCHNICGVMSCADDSL